MKKASKVSRVTSKPKSYPGTALPTPKPVSKVAKPKAKKSKFIPG